MSKVSEVVSGGTGNTVYLSVIGGNLKQKVDESTEGAKLREYEAKDGSTGSKWELTHKNISGKLVSFDFDKKDFGVTFLELVFQGEDGSKALIQLADDSKYASDFMEKLPNIDLNSEMVFNTFDFEVSGKRRTGVSIIQGTNAAGDPNKISTAYFDFDKKVNLLGMPSVSREDAAEYETDDWKMFYLQKKKFLVKATKAIYSKFLANKPVEAKTVEAKKVDDDLPF